jgi:hypothetical protein
VEAGHERRRAYGRGSADGLSRDSPHAFRASARNVTELSLYEIARCVLPRRLSVRAARIDGALTVLRQRLARSTNLQKHFLSRPIPAK